MCSIEKFTLSTNSFYGNVSEGRLHMCTILLQFPLISGLSNYYTLYVTTYTFFAHFYINYYEIIQVYNKLKNDEPAIRKIYHIYHSDMIL